MHDRHWYFVCALGLAMANFSGLSQAQTFGPDKFRTLTVETVLPYYIRSYAPAYELKSINSADQSDFSTPEKTLATFFSALQAGNYVWSQSCWTPASNELNNRINAEKHEGPEYWEPRWRQQYGNKKIELLNKIEYLNYIIIEYKVTVPAQNIVVEQDTLILEQHNNKWLLTQALHDNPIIYAWKAPNNRIQVGVGTVNKLSKPNNERW